MRALFVIAVALLATCGWPMKPTTVYRKAMEAAVDAESDLLLCRAQNATERLRDALCFSAALLRHPYNATWWKQLAALHLMSSRLAASASCLNQSAHTILEAQGFIGPLAKTEGLSHVGMLRLYRRREPEGAYELAKAWFGSHTLHHRLVQAHRLLTDFMEELYPDDRTEFYRELGAVRDVARVKNLGRSKAERCHLCVAVEEIPFAMERWATRMLSGRVLAEADGHTEARQFMKNHCGFALLQQPSYTAAELARFVTGCALKADPIIAALRDDGQHALTKGYLALDRTVAHQLAALGIDYVLRKLVVHAPAVLHTTDNFGRTPLHYAASNRNPSTFALLSTSGADVRARDAGGVTPLALACATMRSKLEQVATPGICTSEREVTEHIVEDEDDDCDTAGGGFDGAAHREDSACSGIDARSLSGLSHDTVVAEYLLSSRPLILRSVPAKVQRLLSRAALSQSSVFVRHEEVPRSEHFGRSVHSANMSLGEFLESETARDFATVESPKGHPLHRRVRFIPDTLVIPQKGQGYTSARDSVPLFIAAKRGAASNHAIAEGHVMLAVAHGRVLAFLRPTSSALSSAHSAMSNVTVDDEVRCTLQGGDVLVVPAMWSRAIAGLSDFVAFERRVYWR